MSVRESDCPGKVLSGKRLVQESSCLGKVLFGKLLSGKVMSRKRPLPLKTAPLICASIECMVPWAHASPLLKEISIGSAIFAGLKIVTDRQADRPHYSICNNRPHLHHVSKNVPPMACYNFDRLEQILIFFGRSVTDKVGSQKML